MRRTLLFATVGFLFLLPPATHAAEPITLRYRHFLFTLTPSAAWHTPQRVWTLRGKPFSPPSTLLVDGDTIPALPDGVATMMQEGWNRDAIHDAIEKTVAPLARDPGKVTIKGSTEGSITFDGVGLPGRSVNIDGATSLVLSALAQGVTNVELPVTEIQPQIVVEDPALAKQGIREVVTVGESDFSNSPQNRQHNITVGLSKFNGALIPPGSIFSFDKKLGRVDDTTGYLKELVIKGDQTIPDYGGGLCQVSTTAYRGVWEYGFPIIQRINHSYMVNHYSPQGTDATVYPPYVDMKFKNDSSGALLIQTYAKDSLAYFIYYGTRDTRKSTVYGPFNWDQTPPPPDRSEPTLDLAPGETKKVGERVPGMKTLWFRVVRGTDGTENIDSTFSSYEARPHYEIYGVLTMPTTSASGSALPTLFMEDQTPSSSSSASSEKP